jgi:hypothetical protein
MPGQDISFMWTILIVLIVIAIFVIFSFLFVRKSSTPPARLRLRNKVHEATAKPISAARGGGMGPWKDRKYNADTLREFEETTLVRGVPTNLNVMFNYNGHSWDAYEVLGIPAGASLEAVRERFNAALETSQPQSQDFIKAALEAILKDRAS